MNVKNNVAQRCIEDDVKKAPETSGAFYIVIFESL